MNLHEHPDALAAYGVLLAEVGVAVPLDRLPAAPAETLGHRLETGYARVRFDGGELDVDDGDAAALATAWQNAVESYPSDETGRGIRVRLELVDGCDGRSLYDPLRSASGVSSVFLADFTYSGRRQWHWPVRVATLPADPLRRPIDSYWHRDLVEVLDITDRFGFCDVAVIPVEAADGAEQVVGPSLLVVPNVSPELVTVDYARSLAARYEASAVAITTGPVDGDEFMWRFLDGLAHNHPPDLAFGMAVGDAAYLMVGDPEFIDSARVSAVVSELRRAVEDAWGCGLIAEADLARAFDELLTIDHASWTAESGAATTARAAVANVEPMVRAVTTTRSHQPAAGEVTPSPRYLQTQVNDVTSGVPKRRRHAFRPGASHEIDVRVGRTSAEWNSAAVEFPVWRLPTDEHQYQLTIDLRAPDLFEGLQSQPVALGHVGDSNTATFPVAIPSGIDRVEMSVTVFYGGLHLQTATLTGPVSEADDDPGGVGIRLLRGDGSTADLESKPDMDISFTKERDVIKVWQRGREPWDVNLPGIAQEVAILRSTLFDAATAVQQLETHLDEDDGLRVLVTLAQHGWVLRENLVGSGALADIHRVAVSSPVSADYLPVEFFYDYGLPDDDASLCSRFLETEDGICDGCQSAGNTAFVCPSGFWGLNRHLEQRVWAGGEDGRDSDCLAPMSSAAQPELPPAADIIFAASSLVNEDEPARIDDTVAAIKAVIGDATQTVDDPMSRVHLAKDWTEWQSFVGSHHPSLLVTLPHRVKTSHGWDALQIGADQDLALIRLEQQHVVARDQTPGPVVLLFGCNTANSDVQYQDFVQRFRCKGASVVVGTLTYVLGPEMSQVAESFVRHLWQARGSATFGEIMQRVRTTMLREHNVMTLALVAYGDADWRFTPGGD
jgi:hypothetical protein